MLVRERSTKNMETDATKEPLKRAGEGGGFSAEGGKFLLPLAAPGRPTQPPARLPLRVVSDQDTALGLYQRIASADSLASALFQDLTLAFCHASIHPAL